VCSVLCAASGDAGSAKGTRTPQGDQTGWRVRENRADGSHPTRQTCLPCLLTVTTTHEPASDLGYLLHKHPGRAQSFHVSAGTAHVFYPEATESRCTVALLLEVDPVGLVRGPKGRGGFALGEYVNDRPYAASSMLSVALGRVFRTAMAGRSRPRGGRSSQPSAAREWWSSPLPTSSEAVAVSCSRA